MNIRTLLFLLLIINIIGCTNKQPIQEITVQPKRFIINPKLDTTLFGAKGTRIFIGSEVFQFLNGETVEDTVIIELKEFYDKADIVLSDLSTVSNGNLLETGGMLYLKAFSKEKPLNIKPTKRIVIHFPKDIYEYKQMDLFYADGNEDDNSVNNWEIDTVNLIKKTLKLGSFGWWNPAHDDSTEYNFIPKNFIDTGYYWNPIDFYVKSYNFSEQTMKELEETLNINNYPDFDSWNTYGAECEMLISKKGLITSPKVVTKLSSSAQNEILTFLKKLPQLEPGKNKYGEIIQRKGLLFIEPGNIVPLYETDEEYVRSFNEKYAKFENTPIQSLDYAELNYYIFSVSKLGWINCDRFVDYENKINLIADLEVSDDLELKLIFKDINGVVKPNIENGKYVFNQMPVGERATVFGIQRTKYDITVAFEEIVISEDAINNLSFSEISLEELKTKLNSL